MFFFFFFWCLVVSLFINLILNGVVFCALTSRFTPPITKVWAILWSKGSRKCDGLQLGFLLWCKKNNNNEKRLKKNKIFGKIVLLGKGNIIGDDPPKKAEHQCWKFSSLWREKCGTLITLFTSKMKGKRQFCFNLFWQLNISRRHWCSPSYASSACDLYTMQDNYVYFPLWISV